MPRVAAGAAVASREADRPLDDALGGDLLVRAAQRTYVSDAERL